MKSRIMYVELKTGYSDNGPAWIGKAFFSKSSKTIYFNGKAFKGGRRELISGDLYWISGVKKDGTDRHWAGGGKISIDKSVVKEYLEFIGNKSLPKNKFEVVELNNNPPKEEIKGIENQKLEKRLEVLFQNESYYNNAQKEL